MHDQSSPSGSLDDESPVADEQTDQVQASKGVLRKPSWLSYEWHIRLSHPGEKQFIHFEKELDLCGLNTSRRPYVSIVHLPKAPGRFLNILRRIQR